MEDLSYLSEEEKKTLADLQPAAKALFLKMRKETAVQERAKLKVEESQARKRRREVLDGLEDKLDDEWIKKTKQGGDEEVGMLAEGVKALKQEMDWLTKKQVRKIQYITYMKEPTKITLYTKNRPCKWFFEGGILNKKIPSFFFAHFLLYEIFSSKNVHSAKYTMN